MFKKCNLTINCMDVYNLMFSRIISVGRKYPFKIKSLIKEYMNIMSVAIQLDVIICFSLRFYSFIEILCAVLLFYYYEIIKVFAVFLS